MLQGNLPFYTQKPVSTVKECSYCQKNSTVNLREKFLKILESVVFSNIPTG
jgi:hypothetical protein